MLGAPSRGEPGLVQVPPATELSPPQPTGHCLVPTGRPAQDPPSAPCQHQGLASPKPRHTHPCVTHSLRKAMRGHHGAQRGRGGWGWGCVCHAQSNPTYSPHIPHSTPKPPDSTWLHRGRGFPLFWWAPTRSSTSLRSWLVPPFPHGGSPSPLWGCGWAPRAPRAAPAPVPAQHTPPGRAVPCHAGPAASTAGPAGTAAAGSEETEAQHGCPDTTEPCPGWHPRAGETRHLV